MAEDRKTNLYVLHVHLSTADAVTVVVQLDA